MTTDHLLRALEDALSDLEARRVASAETAGTSRDLGTAWMAEGGAFAYEDSIARIREALEEARLND